MWDAGRRVLFRPGRMSAACLASPASAGAPHNGEIAVFDRKAEADMRLHSDRMAAELARKRREKEEREKEEREKAERERTEREKAEEGAAATDAPPPGDEAEEQGDSADGDGEGDDR